MRASVGDRRLDELLGGGIPEGSTALVTGPPGIGKTRLALQFLSAGLASGETAALVSPVASRRSLARATSGVLDPDHPSFSFVGLPGPDGPTGEGSVDWTDLADPPEADAAGNWTAVGDGPTGGGEDADGSDADGSDDTDGSDDPTGRDRTADGDGATAEGDGETVDGDDRGSTGKADDGETTRDGSGTDPDGPRIPGSWPGPADLLSGVLDGDPPDRVVVDDVDAIDALLSDAADPARVGATLARRVRDETDATALFAGRHPADHRGRGRRRAGVGSAVAGVGVVADADLRLRGDRVNGDRRRVFRVRKLPGGDHGTRPVEVACSGEGVRAIPDRAVLPVDAADDDRLSTGIEGLDDLLGGGIVRGGSLYLTYDGYSNPVPLAAVSLAEAIEAGHVAVTVPGPGIGYEAYDRVSKLLLGKPVEELLDARDLYIVDLLSTRDRSMKFTATDGDYDTVQTLSGRSSSLYETLRRLFDVHDRPVYLLLDLEPMFHRHGEQEIRELHYWLESVLRDTPGAAVYLDNLRLIPEALTAFFYNSADHTLRLWRGERGSEYVALEAGHSGDVGGTRLVEYAETDPYVRLV